MDVIHNALLDQDKAYIVIDLTNSIWNTILTIAVGIIVGLALAAIVYLTAGYAVPLLLAALPVPVGGVGAGLIATVFLGGAVVGGAVFNSNMLPDDIVLPLYSVTPEEIFSGEMPVFDVDFFNPNTELKELKVGGGGATQEELNNMESTGIFGQGDIDADKVAKEIKDKYNIDVNTGLLSYNGMSDLSFENHYLGDIGEEEDKDGNKITKALYIKLKKGGQSIGSNYGQSEESSYSIGIVSVNSPEIKRYKSIAYQLRPTVAKWYITLRNIAIVGSLSILIYIAIRIIISSSSSDKSKYKQRLYDWVVSLLLIFLMHYIMAGSNLLVKKISGILNSVQKPAFATVCELEDNKEDKIKKALEDNKPTLIEYKILEDGHKVDDLFTEDNGKRYFLWPSNLMGFVRLKAQLSKEKNSFTFAGYTIMFVALVIMTFLFIATYFKRIVYLALLTIIAPLVAMTYALDKLKDGSAQGFNNWFKEYMVNLIIQPMHLLLYTVLISSALELSEINPLYGIIAIGLMMPTEKLVRRFFGVSATETQGLLGGAAGAGIMMAGVNRLLGHRPQGPMHRSSGNGENNAKLEKIRQTENLDTNQIFKKDGKQNDSGLTSAKKGMDIKTIGEPQNNEANKSNNNDLLNGNTGQNIGVDNDLEGTTGQPSGYKKSDILGNYYAMRNAYQEYLKATGKTGSNVTNGMKARRAFYGAKSKAKKKLSKPLNGLSRGLKYYGRGLGKNIANSINNGQLTRRAVRFAGGAATAALAGGIGLAVGVTSGDFSKAGQYAAGAALGGYKFGSSATNATTGVLDVPNAEEYFKRGYMGDQEYEKREAEKQLERLKKEKMNDEFIRDFSLLTDMNEKQAKEYLEKDDFLEQGIKYGFTDANDFAAAKVAKDTSPSQEQAFAKTKLLRSIGSDINKFENDKEGKENFMNSLKDRYRSNGLTDEKELDRQTKILYKDLSKISKTLYKR